ncbi:MAG: SCO family protein [Thermoanaerobaculia bacterium]
MRRLAFAFAVLLAAGVAGVRAQSASGGLAPATAAAAGSAPAALADVSIEQRLDAQLPLDAPFRDESGAPVRLGRYFGQRPVVLEFVYFKCPMLCTYVLNGTVRTLRALSYTAGREFELVAISIDPSDSPAEAAVKKKEFLAEYGRPAAGGGVHFLTGEGAASAKVARAAGFRYSEDRETGGYSHAAGMMLATPQGRMARYFYGLEYSARDLRFSIIEASRGTIGSPVDRVLLYCSHYDPTTGKYGWVVLRIVRLGGIVTVVTLGAFMFVMLRREKKCS